MGSTYTCGMKTKRCPTCKEIKKLSAFRKAPPCRRATHVSYCLPCERLYRQWWYAQSSAAQARSRAAQRRGTTDEQVAAIFKSQGNKCAICKGTEPKGNNWHLDHDHKTGTNRGVLCGSCNRGIGYLQDDPSICTKAATYLLEYSA